MPRKKMCVECGKRPARCRVRGRPRKEVVHSEHHNLCEQCYRAHRNRLRKGRPYGRGKRRILVEEEEVE